MLVKGPQVVHTFWMSKLGALLTLSEYDLFETNWEMYLYTCMQSYSNVCICVYIRTVGV